MTILISQMHHCLNESYLLPNSKGKLCEYSNNDVDSLQCLPIRDIHLLELSFTSRFTFIFLVSLFPNNLRKISTSSLSEMTKIALNPYIFTYEVISGYNMCLFRTPIYSRSCFRTNFTLLLCAN
jgi:hypothetical protein